MSDISTVNNYYRSDICSELFIISIHEGIASTSPALAALWGSLEADLSGAVCGGDGGGGADESDFHRTRERHDRSDRTTGSEKGGSNRKSSDVRQSLPAGNETFAFAEHFYIRLRGLLRSGDSFAFSYGLEDRIAAKKENSGEILRATLASPDAISRVVLR